MKEYVRNILKIFLMRRVLMMQCFQQLVELEYLADWAIGEYGKPFCNKSGWGEMDKLAIEEQGLKNRGVPKKVSYKDLPSQKQCVHEKKTRGGT
ncbi:hypothetical protein HanIR_Chr11g0509211 [Helianthus annuus]|nr:hypothetical protein HanIR_Chr11g0509211 [Helianthus annuus]